MDDRLTDLLLKSAANCERVLIFFEGEQIEGHIDSLGGGQVTVLVRHPGGRLKRTLPVAGITDIAAFEEDEASEAADPLFDLSDDLKARARKWAELSPAEQMVYERTRRRGLIA